MIKVAELRIGNLVKYTGTPYPNYPLVNGMVIVEDIVGNGVNLSMGGSTLYKADKLEGIPITPEWLERMGYVRFQYYTDEYLWSLVDENNTMTGDFCIVEENNRLIPMNGTGGYEYAIAREIQYVHQLQNLFFTLTGEELTIKEPT